MAFRLSAERVFGSCVKPYLVPVGLGLCLTSVRLILVPTSFGQEGDKPLIPGAVPVAMSVASNIGRGCGDLVPPSVLQQDVEARLRGLGVTISSVHSAQLAVDVDCVGVGPGTRMSGVAVHQCLGLSEVVSVPSNDGRAMLATTWRQCQSYTCAGAKCKPLARTGLQTLIDSCLGDFQERHLARQGGQPPHAAKRAAVATVSSAYPETSPRMVGRVLFYSLYIMVCVSVMVYWQCRKQYY
jgi:hypothetical protein